MKEIYCAVGKKLVELPDEAWGDSFDPTTKIAPCNDCGHEYHLKQIAWLSGEARDCELIQLEYELDYGHEVLVRTAKTNEGIIDIVAMCVCNCGIHFPGYKSPRDIVDD